MDNSNLVLLFKSLSASEKKYIRRHLSCHDTIKMKEIARLFNALENEDKKVKSNYSKSYLFQKLYPNLNYNDVKLRLCFSSLLKEILEQLSFLEATADPIRNQLSLVFNLRKKGLTKLFKKNFQVAKSLSEQLPTKNAAHLQATYLLRKEEFEFESKRNRYQDLKLQELSDTLDASFLATKLRQTCLQIAHSSVYNKTYHPGLLEPILSQIHSSNYLEQPAIAIYYYCYKALTESSNEDFFDALKNEIIHHGHLFPIEEIRDIYLLAINYCIKKLNAGELKYGKEGISLYKIGLEKESLTTGGKLTKSTFSNIVGMGIKIQEYQWVNQFITDYQHILEDSHQESTVNFSMARLEFARKNYDKVIELLQHSDYEDVINNIISKTMLMKVYYEMNEIGLLDSLLESMQAFIRRKKIIGYHQKNYMNIVKFTKRLISIPPSNKAALEKLKSKVLSAEILTERQWLIERIGS